MTIERSDLLKLIHVAEQEHQEYIDAMGYDAYRTAKSDAPTTGSLGLHNQAGSAGSRASMLRDVLANLDRSRNE